MTTEQKKSSKLFKMHTTTKKYIKIYNSFINDECKSRIVTKVIFFKITIVPKGMARDAW